jgi:hypothetical protein
MFFRFKRQTHGRAAHAEPARFAAPFSCAEYGRRQRYFQKAPAEMPEMPETPKRQQIEGVQAERTGGRKLAEIGGNPQDDWRGRADVPMLYRPDGSED